MGERASIDEVLLSQAFDALPQAVCLVDSGGLIVGTNAAWDARFSGSAPARNRAIAGASIFDLGAAGASAGNDPSSAAFFSGLRDVLRGDRVGLALQCPNPFAAEFGAVLLQVRRIADSGSVLITLEETRRREDGARVPLFGNEVNEERSVEARLRESEEWFRHLVQGLGAILWEARVDPLAFTFVSFQAEAMLGYPVGRWLESIDFWVDLIHPDDRHAVVDSCTTATARGEDHELEYRMRRSDGSYLWIRDIVRVLTDEAGRPRKLIGLMVDASTQKEAEAAVRETRRHLSQVVEGSPLPIVEMSLGGNVVLWNRAAAASFGWSSEEMVGRQFCGVPAGREAEFARLRELAASGTAVTGVEFRFARKDGVERDVILHAAPILGESGEVLGMTMVVDDVTEARARETIALQLGAAIEHAPDAVYLTDRDGVIRFYNPALERLSGYSPEEILGSTSRLFRSGQHDGAFYQQLWSTVLSGRVWRGRIWNRRKDRTIYHEDKTIAPILDASGAILGFVSIGRDVTQQEALETRVRKTQRMEAVGQLAGGIAHDFNNLLQVIISYIDFASVAVEKSMPEVFADLNESRRAANRAASLTRQLLAFSRRQVLELRPVRLDDVVSDMLKLIGRAIGENITLRFVPGGDGVPAVLADPSQLEQVLLNLCLNARDAMRDVGTLEIRISLETLERPMEEGLSAGAHVVLSVGDSGTGMEPDTLSHIFEPFFTTKAPGKGSGLGLATVYGIVRQHNGFIDVESEPGTGSCFRVFLPAAAEQALAGASIDEAFAALGGSETILVAEDEESVRRLVQRALGQAGYEVIVARDGIEALELFHQNEERVALALLDMIMPKMGGREVSREVRASRPELPMIFCTGYGDEALPAALLPEEGVEVISKPFEIKPLLERVRRLIDRTRSAKDDDA